MKINKYFLVYCALTLVFISERGFLDIFGLTSIVMILRMAAMFAIFPMYWTMKNKFNQLDVLFFAYEIFLILNTVLQDGFTMSAFSGPSNNIAIFMLYEAGLRTRYKEFIKSQFFTMAMITCINFITVLMFPGGIAPGSNVYFLGYYNHFSDMYIMAVCMSLLYSRIYRSSFYPRLVFVVMCMTALLVRSGGVLAFILITAVLLANYRKKRTLGGYFTWWSFPLIFFAGIVLFRLSSLSQYVYVISQYAFNKGGSFLSRAQVWLESMDAFFLSPVFGYGLTHKVAYAGWAAHTHNLLLELLHQGGIIGITLYVAIIIMCGKRLNKLHPRNKTYIALVTAFAGWVTVTLVEPFTTPFMMSLFVLAFRAPQLDTMIRENSAKSENPVRSGLSAQIIFSQP